MNKTETEIKFDKNNYRIHNDKNKSLIKKSLQKCGAGRSIVIDNEGEIIAGNGIFEQAQKLKIPTKIVETDGTELIVVKRTDLATKDAKRKQLAVFDNTTSDSSENDLDKLEQDFNLDELEDFGLEGLGVQRLGDNPLDMGMRDVPVMQYNPLALFSTSNKYDIPDLLPDMLYDGNIDDICFGTSDKLEKDKTYLCLFGSHNIEKTANNNVIGFYVDDHRFAQVYENWEGICEKFKRIEPKAIMTPNFSLWADEPYPFNLFAWYKTQWCGRFWQEVGFKIIPTLNWGDKKTFEFCLLGLPKEIPVASIQIRNIKTKQDLSRFKAGIDFIKDNIKIHKLIVYGDKAPQYENILQDFSCVNIRTWQTKKKEAQNDQNV